MALPGIDHGGDARLLVAGAASVDLAVLELALERVPLPLAAVADVDGVDVGIDHDLGFAAADLADDVAHFVEPDLVETDFAHFPGDALADVALGAAEAGDGDEFAGESDDVLLVGLDGAAQYFR